VEREVNGWWVVQDERRRIVGGVHVAEIADLPGLYDDAEPGTQKRILQSLLQRIEVLGPNRICPSRAQRRRHADSGRYSRGSSARKCVRLVGARGLEAEVTSELAETRRTA
jgi:hypothetical protein